MFRRFNRPRTEPVPQELETAISDLSTRPARIGTGKSASQLRCSASQPTLTASHHTAL